MYSNLQYLKDLKDSSINEEIDLDSAKLFADDLLLQHRQIFMEKFIESEKHDQFIQDLQNFSNDNYK